MRMRLGFPAQHGSQGRAFRGGDLSPLPAGLPDGEGWVVFETGLQRSFPFWEAVAVAVARPVEPAAVKGLQPGLDFPQKIQITSLLEGLPGKACQERDGQPVPALTGQTGLPVHRAIL